MGEGLFYAAVGTTIKQRQGPLLTFSFLYIVQNMDHTDNVYH
jgi:hypothetical protein